jgi:acyl-CoA synthetase (AMP-forming)/AMP-acid ligase II
MTVLSRLLATHAVRRPEAVAFRGAVDGTLLTWQDVAAGAERWRRAARDRRLPARARIGLVAPDPLAFVSGYLGCLAAGLTAVPFDPRLTPDELGTAMGRLRVDVLAAGEPESVRALPGVELWHLTPHGPRPARTVPRGPRPSDAAALRPAVLLTSSGTTGTPKGIPLSEWQLTHAARRVVRHHRLGPAERGYTPLPLFHVNAQVIGVLATVLGGGSLVVDRRFDAGAYWDRVAEWQPTWLNAVPAILTTLAGLPEPPERVTAGIRFARSASAPLAPDTLRAFETRTGIGVLETYGMSEAAGQITANPLGPALRRPGSVGRPVGLGLTVLAPDGRPAGPGEEGAVLLRGRPVVADYLDLSDTGAERRRPARDASGRLPTGDVGFRDDAGFVYLAGRADDVINRGGEKIHPREVENVLLGHPSVASVAVVAAPDPRLGQVPVAFVTTDPAISPAQAPSVEELNRLCEARLARYKRPTAITIVGALPLGPTGKVLRRTLRAGQAATGSARW